MKNARKIPEFAQTKHTTTTKQQEAAFKPIKFREFPPYGTKLAFSFTALMRDAANCTSPDIFEA